jgi:hypothetical protein
LKSSVGVKVLSPGDICAGRVLTRR